MRVLILLIAFVCCQISYAEDFYTDILGTTACYINHEKGIFTIPEEPMEIEGKSSKMVSLLQKDLFLYFDLNEEYPTPLQQSQFKKTEEYAMLAEAFDETLQNTKTRNFYILYDLYQNCAYNINSKSFKFKIGINDYDAYTKTGGYISLGNDICISYPTSRLSVKKTLTSNGEDYWLDQYISTPVISEDVALKIEKAMGKYPCPYSLLFVVKPNSVAAETKVTNFGGYVGRQRYTTEFIMFKTIGLYVVNTETYQVICDLSAYLTSSAPKVNKK